MKIVIIAAIVLVGYIAVGGIVTAAYLQQDDCYFLDTAIKAGAIWPVTLLILAITLVAAAICSAIEAVKEAMEKKGGGG